MGLHDRIEALRDEWRQHGTPDQRGCAEALNAILAAESSDAGLMARKTLKAIPQAALRSGSDGWDAQKRLDAVLETYETHHYRGATMHAAKKIWFHETGESCPICGPLPLAPEEET